MLVIQIEADGTDAQAIATGGPNATLSSVVERIRDLSAEGPLPAERQLAEQLGINRYMLRKALAVLRAEEEIPASRPRNSGRLRKSTHAIALASSPAEVWEVRLTLEPEITRLAAVRGTEMEIRAIELIHDSCEPAIFDVQKDIAFHMAIAQASHNVLAAHLMYQVTELTRDPAFRTKLPDYTAETGWRHHAAIVEAIRGRRASEAEEAMRTHIVAILQWLNGGSSASRHLIK